jgi:UDP-N-acetylmuramate dehydrogenase
MFVLGGGSNLVVADGGIEGLVVQVALHGLDITPGRDFAEVRAGAGESWDGVVSAAVDRGYAGIECLSGIPGFVGGTPIQNVGAYGQDVAETLRQVTAFDRRTGLVVTIPAAECRFAYRTSRFKHEDAGRFIVCEVLLDLHRGAPTVTYPDVVAFLERQQVGAPTVGDVRRAVLAVRRAKGMVLDPADPDTHSVGSFFTNPVVPAAVHARIAEEAGSATPGYAQADGQVKIPAAWLIERSGVSRAEQSGGAALSSKHPLAIVNRGGATARDVLRLAARIKRQVVDRFGVWLVPEPVFAGFRDDADVEYLRKAAC